MSPVQSRPLISFGVRNRRLADEKRHATASAAIEPALRMSWALLPLVAVAAFAGFLVHGLYRDPAAIVPALRGQDLLTLLVVPLLSAALPAARRGSARWTIVWIALVGYLLYTYTGAAFAYTFNPLFPLYVAIFSLSLATIIAALRGVDTAEIASAFDPTLSRTLFVVVLLLFAALVALPEAAQIVEYYRTGVVPEIITRAESPTSFIYVLDLGVITPLMLLAARWLHRSTAPGWLLTGILLVKSAAMGLALLSMTALSLPEGIPLEPGFTAIYAVIAAMGIGFSIRFLRYCRR